MARVTRVVVKPLSGYVNRIQALTSSYLLAQDLGAEFAVDWRPDSAAPADPTQIFDPMFLTRMSFGADLPATTPYLNSDTRLGRITLAGLDRGEQVFMTELKSLIDSMTGEVEVWISAGGKFSLDVGDFESRRRDFYRHKLLFTPRIESQASALSHSHPPFLGLHLRYSDRNHQAPSRKSIGRAVTQLRERSGLSSIFVASDSATERDHWLATLRIQGMDPWCVNSEIKERSDSSSAESALLDWRLLGLSHGVIFFSESSFGEEAAVSAGQLEQSAGLAPSLVRSRIVVARRLLFDLVSYPKRHWFH